MREFRILTHQIDLPQILDRCQTQALSTQGIQNGKEIFNLTELICWISQQITGKYSFLHSLIIETMRSKNSF